MWLWIVSCAEKLNESFYRRVFYVFNLLSLLRQLILVEQCWQLKARLMLSLLVDISTFNEQNLLEVGLLEDSLVFFII